MAASPHAPPAAVAWDTGRPAARGDGGATSGGPRQATGFADRGATVPFETPALLGARVRRDDRKRLEILLANFSGNSSATVVVPWVAVPETVPMLTPDRALHAEIAERSAVTPGAIRAAAASVALSGAAGPEAAAAARGRAALERARTAALQACLLPRVIAACRVDLPACARLTEADPALMGGALQAAGARMGVRPAALFARTEALAGLLTPVGLGGGLAPDGIAPGGAQAADPAEAAGPLRLLHEQLCMVRGHLVLRGRSAPAETRGYFARAAAAAHATATLTLEVVTGLDAQLADLPRLLGDWDARGPDIARAVERLEWLLDGWEQTLDHYARHIGDWLALSQQRTLDVLAALTPTLPATETARLRHTAAFRPGIATEP